MRPHSEDETEVEPPSFHVGEHRVDRGRRRAPGGEVEIEHRVDEGGAPGGGCATLESMAVDARHCVTPHEMGADPSNGDLYLACITSNRTFGAMQGLLRYRRAARKY